MMKRLQKFIRSVLNFGKEKITARVDEINAGLEENNIPRVILNCGILILIVGISLFLCAFLLP